MARYAIRICGPDGRSAIGNEACPWHNPTPAGYSEASEDAERRRRLGQKQRWCEDCRKWFWRAEFSRRPR